MNTKLIETREDRIVIERTVPSDMFTSLVVRRVTLPKITMQVKWMEERK